VNVKPGVELNVRFVVGVSTTYTSGVNVAPMVLGVRFIDESDASPDGRLVVMLTATLPLLPSDVIGSVIFAP
jgi:hypothetical protein